jgi:hypothetical protein
MTHKTLLFALLSSVVLACHPAQKAQTTPPGFVSWDKKMIELGPVKRGEKRSMTYEFTNTFNAALGENTKRGDKYLTPIFLQR